MTKENLLRYLRDPEYLHQISYQELKTLVAEHPNSYTLRQLLAIKSRQEGNDDFTRQKEFAALYSIDRPHLFDILTRAEILETLPEGVLLQEDYLELKELSTLEKELSMTGAIAASTAAAIALPDIPTASTLEASMQEEELEPTVDEDIGEYYTLDFDQDIYETTSDSEVVLPGQVNGSLAEIDAIFEEVDNEEPIQVSTEILADEIIVEDSVVKEEFIDIPLEIINLEEQAIEGDHQLPEPELEKVVATMNPQPKSKFSTWKTPKSAFAGFDLIGYNSRGMIDELANKQIKKRSTNTTIITQNDSRIVDNANESLEFESDIASETLAKILIIQGHYIKAIAMYERLSLIFPEKSGLFAAEIKKIENLEDRSA